MTAGLSQHFILDSGRFSFTKNEDKAKDNLGFFMSFLYVRRIYMTDFNPEISWVNQKPASVVLAVKNLMLGNLQRKILRYVPNINIEGMNALYDRNNKEYAIFVNYTYLNNSQIEELVTFV